MNELLKLLVKNNNPIVFNETINYYGWEEKYKENPHNIYGSVNNYFAGPIPEVTKNMLSKDALNQPQAKDGDQTDMESLEFITIHDTGGGSPTSTATNNSHWCTNPNNTGTSWHYTIGNDGIFQQLEDTKVAWHGGDGTSWGRSTVLTDTKIKVSEDLRYRPKTSIKDGYVYLDDVKTEIKAPVDAKTIETNTLGLVVARKNGTYHIPTLHTCSKGYNGVIACLGGNLNSIGIETCVNTTSDVYLTWEYTAKHVARLLVSHNLTPDRVVFHNNWSNKLCPQTMMTSNKVETFLDMVYCEYEVLKNFPNYKIEFISHNPDILDNSGRIIKEVKEDTIVSYTIQVKDGENVDVVTCTSIIKGNK